MDAQEIARQVLPSVVEIRGTGDSEGSGGSGFLVTPDGKIFTCLHVIAGLTSGAVRLASGEIFDSFKVLAFDERRDLAIIKVPGFDLPTVGLGNSNEIQSGEPVALLGNPHGLRGTITTGVVSALRDLPEGLRVIQTDAAANPGSSGAPMVNTNGKAIGVVSFKLSDSEGLGFAVSINYLRGLLDSSKTQVPFPLRDLGSRLGKTSTAFKGERTPKDPLSIIEGSKTIAVVQEADGNPELLATVQKELIKWKKYLVVTSYQDADLVLVLSPTANPNLTAGKGAKAAAFLRTRDGTILWTDVKGGDWSMAGYSFPRVGRALVKELRKFVSKR